MLSSFIRVNPRNNIASKYYNFPHHARGSVPFFNFRACAQKTNFEFELESNLGIFTTALPRWRASARAMSLNRGFLAGGRSLGSFACGYVLLWAGLLEMKSRRSYLRKSQIKALARLRRPNARDTIYTLFLFWLQSVVCI